jgi:RimJ/RimL family protein N-acetyltransferase
MPASLGPFVDPVDVPPRLRTLAVSGQDFRLRAPVPAQDAAPLFAACVGADPMWNWMGYGPFSDVAELQAWMEACCASSDPRWFAIERVNDGVPIGMAALMNLVAGHRRIELGNIWYVPAAQRTTANTEVTYLAAKESFEYHKVRRFEWKCDALNLASRAAALRLGFTFEGIFRRHFIIKGRNRDTAWYSITDAEWPRVRAAMEQYLYETPRDENGRPTRSLSAAQPTG